MTTAKTTPVTPAEIEAQGVTCNLDFAARAIGIGKSLAYTSAAKGEFPCRVIRTGARYTVPTADLKALLGL